ncbi:hypothetical protein L228DRAFT_249691 [Xylona heveae TC161]|uniref:Chaperone/heat shock protein Hsp12 n=1 Tax=Xylona heveae (strain CBS 132557 / TC161) TaxID=1328760 RepID=A0A165FE41_XYLHT|nr:hypothetical protein L228DRAFT_249691 [Xylona heveae TC161]KZF20872.1 hypothetical protein L228DRAFT_249691 [Xylona heveae TC161]
MADLGRKDFSTQAKEKVTPDSQKSYLDQTKESVTGTADKLAGSVQPSEDKSTTQSAFDTTRSNKDDAKGTSQSYLDSAKDTVANAAGSVQNALGGGSK